MSVRFVQVVTRALVDFLYPPTCGACGRFGAFFCERCVRRADEERPSSRCPTCAAELDGAACADCRRFHAVSRIVAPFAYRGVARRAVHAVKYGAVRAAVPALAAALSERAGDLSAECAYAVPIHPVRRRQRGFNQAEELRKALAIPAGPGRLQRVRRTRPQVGLSLEERRANVAGAFAYEGPPLGGASVLLVDDVVTTGATVEECARVLRAAGAGSVVVVAFARASVRLADARSPIHD